MIVLKVVIQILVKIHDFLFGYPGEPEYQEEELNLIESSDDNKSNFYNEKENNLNSSREKITIRVNVIKSWKTWFVTNHEAFDNLILYKLHLSNIVVIMKIMNLKLVILFVIIINSATLQFIFMLNMNSLFSLQVFKLHHKKLFCKMVIKKDQNQNLYINCSWFLFTDSYF